MKGIGALITTFGVGELSALNAIAGSYAEYVPVVHIVGSPSTTAQRERMLLHHTLGDGDYKAFANIYKQVTVAQANLDDLDTATAEIDSVLRTCWLKSRPVYIELPSDMVTKDVSADGLNTPLDISFPTNDTTLENTVAEDILSRLYSSKKPVLLVDGCVTRHHLKAEAAEFVRKTGLLIFTTPMGKGTIDESLPGFSGLYAGSGSHDNVREVVESSDMVLSLGLMESDINTMSFTYNLPTHNAVDLHTEFLTIEGQRFDLHMYGLLNCLTSLVDASKLVRPHSKLAFDVRRAASANLAQASYPNSTITHEYLWQQLSTWLQPNDILCTEIGSSYLGVWDTQFPANVFAISQTLWGSIGYTLPAAQGVALAARELGRPGRVILFEGDGSSQLTAQAIGTMLKLNLDIIIFLINNDGYTVERWVHGMEESYNDIPAWKYSLLPETMGARLGEGGNARAMQIRTRHEIEALWQTEEFKNVKGMQFVEVFMPKLDAPVPLKMFCTSAEKNNSK
jgi:pyruvate decarboxylase